MNNSIMSFPERGPWGDPKWRGNASGYVYKSLFEQYNPKSFIDPCQGSGTSIMVANEMGIEAHGLDLHSGFNALRDSIVETVGKEVDMCFSHPPYGSIIRYSKDVWNNGIAHPDDLSECRDDEDFCQKLMVMLLNQREATLPNGYYGCLIGDVRHQGKYSSYQAEMIARMPRAELASLMIKTQHNCVSDNRTYSKMKHPRIMHEYVILWQKPKEIRSMLVDLSVMAKEAARRLTSVWLAVVKNAMIALGGKSCLSALYERIEKQSPEALKSNKNWQAKIRQVLQQYSDFSPVERGVWKLA